MKAILAEWFYLPLEHFSSREVTRLRRLLTVTPKAFRDDEVVEPIEVYNLSSKSGYIGVPVDWGLKQYANIDLIDKTVEGEPMQPVAKWPDPNHPKAAPNQEKFMKDMLQVCLDNYAALAIAPTGSGKTVTALYTSAKLGRRTMIVAPNEQLGLQWIEEIVNHLGIPRDRIGWVQQDKCDYKDKDFVIGIINSVGKRKYPEAFYASIGTVIWDEVHVTGARSFSQTLHKFAATYRIALTATPNRKDRCDEIYKKFFGHGQVEAQSEALKAKVVVVDYNKSDSLPDVPNGVLTNILAKDPRRNRLLVKWIGNLFDDRRNVLVIGDRIAHLEELIRMCEKDGIPKDAMGLFTATKTSDKKATKLISVRSAVRGAELVYSPPKECAKLSRYLTTGDVVKVCGYQDKKSGIYKVRSKSGKVCLARIEHLKKEKTLPVKMVKVGKEELKKVKKDRQIIFATYGMMKQGLDVPRLDAGIDATPRSEGIQVVGRIRRPVPNKRTPIWITIRDTASGVLIGRTSRRIADYRQANCEVIKYGQN